MSDSTAPMPVVAPEAPKRRGRGTAAVVASVVAVLVIAGGGFAAWRFLAGSGPRPAEVLPASTFAVMTLDLDPSGGQKIEAIKTLRTFPSFRVHAGVNTDSDLVKALYDKTIAPQCKGVSYAQDIAPWIGQRIAVAGVPGAGSTPLPVVALQIKDRKAAGAGVAKLEKCHHTTGGDDFGYTLTDDYLIASDTTAHARQIAADGARKPLSQTSDYQQWTDAAGGAGILNMYAAPGATQVVRDLIGDELDSLGSLGGQDPTKELDKQLSNFRGAAAVLKFRDSGLELSWAAGTKAPAAKQASAGDHVSALPKDSALVLAAAFDPATLKKVLGRLGDTRGMARSLESSTGLRFPADITTLLGDSISLSVGGDAPADLRSIKDPGDLPVGVLVHGDADKIKTVVGRVEQRTGQSLEGLGGVMKSGGDKVALATTQDYAGQLLGKGGLGDSATFRDVVPNAEKSPAILYVSLDNGWGDALAQLAADEGGKGGRELSADVKSLRALGISGWQEDGDTHGLLRLTLR